MAAFDHRRANSDVSFGNARKLPKELVTRFWIAAQLGTGRAAFLSIADAQPRSIRLRKETVSPSFLVSPSLGSRDAAFQESLDPRPPVSAGWSTPPRVHLVLRGTRYDRVLFPLPSSFHPPCLPFYRARALSPASLPAYSHLLYLCVRACLNGNGKRVTGSTVDRWRQVMMCSVVNTRSMDRC